MKVSPHTAQAFQQAGKDPAATEKDRLGGLAKRLAKYLPYKGSYGIALAWILMWRWIFTDEVLTKSVHAGFP